jgi:putative toprim domain protein
MAAHHRMPKTKAENVQLAQARDTLLRAQEARREDNAQQTVEQSVTESRLTRENKKAQDLMRMSFGNLGKTTPKKTTKVASNAQRARYAQHQKTKKQYTGKEL